MIDPLFSLAFSVHENTGVHALLMGPGVSRGAGIPTGWEVVLGWFEESTRGDVEGMISGVNRSLGEHLG